LPTRAPDPTFRDVDCWPKHLVSERATALGLAADPDFDSIVRD